MTDVRATRLSNGLTILTRELHHAPVASFWVWYRVGGRNEVSGVTGISHWVEHMLFKGTAAFKPGDIFRQVTKNGGTLNGFTWIDYTTYFETLPSDRIDLALRIESDRMVNSLFDADEVASERTVIISEREGHENEPTWHLDEEITAAAFKVHPYANGVIGWKCDLRAMTRDDLYNHYRRYYVPGNAIAVAVGDFQTDQMIAQIEQHFGAIPAGPTPPEVRSIEPIQEGERRIHLRRPAPTSYLQVAYQAPSASDPDAFPMLVLDAILSGAKSMGMMGGRAPMGRSARLYRALVSTGMATSARSSFALTRDPFAMDFSLTLRSGIGLADAERTLFGVIAEVAADGPTEDEIARATKQIRAQFSYGAETVTSQAYWLGSLEVVASHTLFGEFLERVAAVTAADVRRVAATYLTEQRRTVGWLEPTEPGGAAGGGHAAAAYRDSAGPFFWRAPVEGAAGGPAAAADRGSAGPFFWREPVEGGAAASADRAPTAPISWREPVEGGGASAAAPAPAQPLAIERQVLSNGLVLLGHANPSSQAVTMRAMIRTGAVHDTDDRAGTARLTGSMLQRGTAHHTFEELNDLTDGLGLSISSDVGRQTSEVTVKCLTEDLDVGIGVLAEVMREPTFPADQLEKVRGELLTGLREADQDTRSVAERAFRELAYPAGHPFRRRVSGYAETVVHIGRDDLVTHHARTFRPDLTTIAVAGGVDVVDAFARLERAFGDWTASGEPPSTAVEPVPAPTGPARRVVELAGKTQADIVLGRPSIERNHPDYYALDMLNMILGRLGLNGRIGANVREKQGLAYYSYSDLEGGLGPGAWGARAGVNPANVDRAIEAILTEVRGVQEQPVTEEEIADAKSYVTGILPLALESNDGVARTMLSIELYDLGLDYLARYPAIIRALTREQLQSAAQRYLSADTYALAIVRPEGSQAS